MNLDINSLNRLEAKRKTAIGQEMHAMVQGSKTIPAEMIIRMLKMIVFNCDPRKNKFILTSFPDIIEQAGAFEALENDFQEVLQEVVRSAAKAPAAAA